MKLVEKTCPKCGANLEFKPEDKEVRCSYCNKSFIIEEDPTHKLVNNVADSFNLVAKTVGLGIGVQIAIGVIIFLVALGIIVAAFFNIFISDDSDTDDKFFETVEKEKDSKVPAMGDTTALQTLAVITKEDQAKIEKKSLTCINKWNKTGERLTLVSSKHLGYYLAASKSFSTLYDVYELQYKDASSLHTVYTGVKYSNTTYKDKTLNVSNPQIFGDIKSLEMASVWGYDSVEDLYNSINTPLNEKITATENLYIN